MKITRIPERPARGPAAPARPKSAMEAAIEKKLSQYVHLICGHVTTWQDDEFYRMRSSPRDKFYCDKCGRWVKPKPKPKPAPLPDEPLF